MAEPTPGTRARTLWRLLAALLLLGLTLPAAAESPVDLHEFDSPAQESRYRALIAELRCPKCLNTNLAGSDAPIATDLRRTVHRLITEEGMSDEEIRAFLQARYGDFVLYEPPFRPDTWILWLGPVAFLTLGALVIWRMLRQPPREPLSADESHRLRSMLENDR
ncbi:MAG: cytochrome c-type biogenesis protein [Pseudomonadota bacterium]